MEHLVVSKCCVQIWILDKVIFSSDTSYWSHWLRSELSLEVRSFRKRLTHLTAFEPFAILLLPNLFSVLVPWTSFWLLQIHKEGLTYLDKCWYRIDTAFWFRFYLRQLNSHFPLKTAGLLSSDWLSEIFTWGSPSCKDRKIALTSKTTTQLKMKKEDMHWKKKKTKKWGRDFCIRRFISFGTS